MGSHEEDADDDEKEVHLVNIKKAFYIGLFPVTQEIWKAVMDEHNPSYFKGDKRPVEQVSWKDIRLGGQDKTVRESFLDRLNNQFLPKKEGFENYRFRLPSEAEWEYAAKGGHLAKKLQWEGEKVIGKTTDYYTSYAGSDKLKEVGWFNKNAHRETKEVGQKMPNQLGLFDMNGNVWEWCEDDWHNTYIDAPADGSAWLKEDRSNTLRVIRGGAWLNVPQDCRVACRFNDHPSGRSDIFGFRLVLSSSETNAGGISVSKSL